MISLQLITQPYRHDYKYHGCVLAPNGNVVFVPHMANSVGIFDPVSNVFSAVLKTLHPPPCDTLHPGPYTLHPSKPFTLHPTP